MLTNTFSILNDIDGYPCDIIIHLDTRRIEFAYTVCDDLAFRFDLLSEVGENWQRVYKGILKDNGIKLGIHDGDDGYYNVVMFPADLSILGANS